MEKIQRAIKIVSEEISFLRDEIDVLIEFREVVSHTHPSKVENVDISKTNELLEYYEGEYSSTIDNNYTFRGHLKEELSIEIFKTLLNSQPFTYRLKRKLLIQINTAIDQRKLFLEALEQEKNFLTTGILDLQEINVKIRELPDCRIEGNSLEELLNIWEKYNDLEERCNDWIAKRQQHFSDLSQTISIHEENGLYTYLYDQGETQYPFLTTISSICEEIKASKEISEPLKNTA